MNNDDLEIALLQRMREINRMRKLELELLEQFDSKFQWLIRFCDERGIEIPDREGLHHSLKKIPKLLDQIYPDSRSPEVKRPSFSPEDDNGTGAIMVYKAGNP